MTFFYDLNKRLATLADKQDLHESKVAESEKWIQKAVNPANKGNLHKALHVAQDEKIPKAKIEKATHSKNPKLRHMAQFAKNVAKEDQEVEESGLQAYLGKKKYGDEGMKALQKAGRDHAGKEKMAKIRAKYDKMDEADMEEGNAFTDELRKTPKGGKFKMGNKEYTDTSDLEEGFKEMDAWLASREKEKGTGKFDKKERTLPGGTKATTYTRKHEDDEEDKDDEVKSDAPKKKGRPKSAASKDSERVTKGSHKYKTVDGKRVKKEKTKEDLDSDGVLMTRSTNCSSESIDHDMEGSHDRDEAGEYGAEGDYVKNELHTMVRVARDLEKHLRDNEDLPTWCIGKLSQAKGMVVSVMDYIISEKERGAEQHMEPMAEKAVSQAQRRAAGIAHAAQKGEIPKSRLRGASKEMAKMPQGELHKFAATKEKGLPKKVKEGGKPDFLDLDKDGDKKEPMKKAAKEKSSNKEDKVDETTVAGSVATATTSGKSSKGGMQFGKGVYEGFNRQVESMITEGMNISVNMNAGEDGQTHKSITVSAEGAEADQLAALLKMAGLHGQAEEACDTCGASPCGCEQTVDEAYGDTDETLNNPDWPTNTETLAADPELRTYSGGLDGPKSTKQGTLTGGGLPSMSPRRQVSMEESVELERSLFKTWKNYKG